MKIRNIFILISIIVFLIIVLTIIRFNETKRYSSKINEQKDDYITNENNQSFIQDDYNIDITTSSEIATNSIYSYSNKDNIKSNNNSINKTVDTNLTEDDKIYYFHKNWLIEDVVVDTIKENLSIFDRLDGKKAEVKNITKRVYKWLQDLNDKYSYVKNTFVLVPISYDSEHAYKYYFDNNGYLIKDNISKDFTIIDGFGREIDNELKPIEYYIGNKTFSIKDIKNDTNSNDTKEDVYKPKRNQNINATPSQVIITEGVVFRKKLEQIYNTKIDTNLIKYIKSGYSYSNNVKATVYSNAKWKDALRLNGDKSYVVFENFTNNFNRIYGKVSMGAAYNNETDTICKVFVYDKDEYDKNNFSDYIVCIEDFNFTEPKSFSFTFDRSIKNIVFLLEITGNHRTKSVYFKDLKFGFNKNAYRQELIRKSEDAEEINYLKSLGLYVEDDNYFDIIDDDGNLLIDEELLEDREWLASFDDYDEYVTDLADYSSGPDFDKALKKKNEDSKLFGPYIDIIGTSSNIFSDSNKKKRQSKIIYTN